MLTFIIISKQYMVYSCSTLLQQENLCLNISAIHTNVLRKWSVQHTHPYKYWFHTQSTNVQLTVVAWAFTGECSCCFCCDARSWPGHAPVVSQHWSPSSLSEAKQRSHDFWAKKKTHINTCTFLYKWGIFEVKELPFLYMLLVFTLYILLLYITHTHIMVCR